MFYVVFKFGLKIKCYRIGQFKSIPFFCAHEIIDLYLLLGRICDLWNGFTSTYKLSDLNTAVPRTDDGCYLAVLGGL